MTSLLDKAPHGGVKVWHYMDFTKFTDFMERQALFFCAAEALEDRFEGTFPPAQGSKRPPEEDLDKVRRMSLVSSWHMSEQESFAMWKLYLKAGEGVALQSTYARLQDSFDFQKLQAYIGTVRYYDPFKDQIPLESHLSPLAYKDVSFSFEREVRILLDLYDSLVLNPRVPRRQIAELEASLERYKGLRVPTRIETLVERVVVSPLAQPWLSELVEITLRRFGLERLLVSSSLSRSRNG